MIVYINAGTLNLRTSPFACTSARTLIYLPFLLFTLSLSSPSLPPSPPSSSMCRLLCIWKRTLPQYFGWGNWTSLNLQGKGWGVRGWGDEGGKGWGCDSVCVTLLSSRLMGGPSLHMLWIMVSFHRMTSESEPVTLEWTHSLVATCSVFCILYSPSKFKVVLTVLSRAEYGDDFIILILLHVQLQCAWLAVPDMGFMRLVLIWVFVIMDAHVTCSKIYTFIINCMQLQGFPIDSHTIMWVRRMIMFFVC